MKNHLFLARLTCLRSRLLRTGLSGLLLSAAVLANSAPLQNTESRDSQVEFNLLPRSLQKNPRLDQTVITELTAEGKKLPVPSPANPVYYVTESVGFHAEGHSPEDRRLPKAEELAASFQSALAVNGYRPATPEHLPSLLIVYYWGSHTNLDSGSEAEGDTGIPDVDHKNLLSRAALVGGTRFAAELRQALEQQDLEDKARELARPHQENDASRMIDAMAVTIGNAGPLARFINRDTKTSQLFNEACSDCYYLVASAYDYATAARGQRRLLWRSKMTIDSQAVAMRDTLPGLIFNAGKYFGVDMPEAATMTKRMIGEGSVKLGPLEIKEWSDPEHPPDDEKPAAKQHP